MQSQYEEKLKYAYHAVPKMMAGNTLYPLNSLRNIFPEAYDFAAKKYEWRKNFLSLSIPRLGCLWNDVLHFTIIHPRDIFQELRAAGYSSKNPWLFYEVPLASVLTSPYAVYDTPPPRLDAQTYTPDLQAPEHVIDPDRVKLPGEFDFRQSPFPQATRDYFKFELAHGRIPLAFNGLPHFLLHAPLDVSGFSIVDGQEPG